MFRKSQGDHNEQMYKPHKFLSLICSTLWNQKQVDSWDMEEFLQKLEKVLEVLEYLEGHRSG